jgi:hypothetical protein
VAWVFGDDAYQQGLARARDSATTKPVGHVGLSKLSTQADQLANSEADIANLLGTYATVGVLIGLLWCLAVNVGRNFGSGPKLVCLQIVDEAAV